MSKIANFAPIILILLYFLYSIYAPQKVKDIIGLGFLKCFSMLFDLLDVFSMGTRLCVVIAHFVGRLCVVGIFLVAVIALSNEVGIVFGHEFISKASNIVKVISLIEEKKLSWIAATAIIAATVALGHFRTLDLAIDKYQDEQKEKLESMIKDRKSRL